MHLTKFSTASMDSFSTSHLIRAGPLSLNLPYPATLGEPDTGLGLGGALRCRRSQRSNAARPSPLMTASSQRQAITCGKLQRDHSGSTPRASFSLAAHLMARLSQGRRCS